MPETEKKPRAPRKAAEPAPKYIEVADPAEAEEEKPTVLAASLIRNNEVARNSASVRAVQDALIERGHWDVKADPAGYWGPYTQDAALTETDEDEPIKAAEALGFTVLPAPPAV